MIFDIVTIFPEMFTSLLGASLYGKAIARGLFAVHFVDPREFAEGKHRSVDDTPYGGGAGMVMRPEPLVAALEHAIAARGPGRRLLLTPTGRLLDRATTARLAGERHLLLVCGRYEGVDDRVRTHIDEELSIGDYVLSGGEPAAMVVLDAVARRLPGVLGNAESPIDESFEGGLLEYPQFTRPAQFRGAGVPEALLSGNHERIRRWRRWASLQRTQRERPDLLARVALNDEDRALLDGEEP
jgi:tRNA (guanine37-N1)-methyltransferase